MLTGTFRRMMTLLSKHNQPEVSSVFLWVADHFKQSQKTLCEDTALQAKCSDHSGTSQWSVSKNESKGMI